MAHPTVLLAVVLLSTLAMAVAGVKEEVRVEITSAQPGNVKVTTSYQYDAQVCGDAAAPIPCVCVCALVPAVLCCVCLSACVCAYGSVWFACVRAWLCVHT